MGTNNQNKQQKNNVKNKKLNKEKNSNLKNSTTNKENNIDFENNNIEYNKSLDNNNNNSSNNNSNNNNNNNSSEINNNKNKLLKNKVVQFKIIEDNPNMDISGCSSNDESEAILKKVKETLKHEDDVEIIGTSDQIISNSTTAIGSSGSSGNGGSSKHPMIRNNSSNNINEIISGGEELSGSDEEYEQEKEENNKSNNYTTTSTTTTITENDEEDLNNSNTHSTTEEDDEREEEYDYGLHNYYNTSNDEKEINEEDEKFEKEKIIQKYKLNRSSNKVLITNTLKKSIDNEKENDISEKLAIPEASSGGEYSSSANSPMPTLKLSVFDDKTTMSKRELGQHVDGKDVANVVSESLNLESNNKHSSFKILEKKKSLDNLELNPFLKSLSEKRNNFIKKITQKVWSTLNQATSDDLSTSQKDRIIQEVFKDISLEIDEPVFEYLTTLSDKDIEKVNNNLNQSQPQSSSPINSPSIQSGSKSPTTFTIPTFKNSSKKDGILNNYYPYPCLDVAAKRLKLTPTAYISNTSPSTSMLNTSSSSTRIGSGSSTLGSSGKGILNSSTSSGSGYHSSGSGSGKENSPNEKEIYYYQLISQYFLNNPDKVELFRPLLQSLWTNNQWFYLIYGSMFFSWLLEYRLSLTPQLNILIKASNRLFWYDCDRYTRKYYQIYSTIKQKLVDRSLWNGLCEASKDLESTSSNDPDLMRTNLLRNRRIWIDFYHIISVFYFYYEKTNEGLDEFRYNINRQYQDFILDTIQKKHIASENNNNNSNSNNEPTPGISSTKELVLSIDDLFVRGVIKHLNLIKHEETLIGYIDRCLVFKENWDLNPTTKVKLQSCLYSLTKPGSPAYVPRSVRTKSRAVLDQLFPNGKFSRHTVNLFFRLLHPYYSIGSIIHWGLDFIKSYIPFLNNNSNNKISNNK
ncbi:hypothetical protein DICPUDRAFT_152145 [Dictyostelium purpureum]|uniref:Uncharacterized protein n=1 Tax=Dictyostelium purpureum TaxID=5786 RepID=F0ZKK7_DICPU|nr:uncharacterized protein DICPUDRAFT_152145 [Dictyostelium purpureum]EGC35529.1 hypothetical protein DICPUDRAFT_152145 [Dictyostelium purpureum]|eukprot:XP_003287955.1 hypothetical protein DICPUDRAFT_152145 [Dictyostelium purpureum]